MKKTKDYSLYTYYKGDTNYTSKKAKFFGKFEEVFEETYKDDLSIKEEAFKMYIADILYEQASDIYMFGLAGVNKWKCYREYLAFYFNPKLDADLFER